MRIDSSGNVTGATISSPVLSGTTTGTYTLGGTPSLAATALTGTIAAARLPAGSVLQVIQTVKTDTFFTSSTSYVEVTGLSASITPSNSNNKILVFVDIKGWAHNAQVGGFQLLRNSTAVYIGDGAGSRQQVSIGGLYAWPASAAHGFGTGLACYVDSPGTTASTTYKLQCRTLSTGIYVNRQHDDANNNDNPRSASSITLMEIAG